jgi:hypothetical protein
MEYKEKTGMTILKRTRRLLVCLLAATLIFGLLPVGVPAGAQAAGATVAVPDNWQNKIMTNGYFSALKLGESTVILTRTSGVTFEIESGDSVTLSKDSGDEKQVTAKAVKYGTSVIKISSPSVPDFNTAYYIVQVEDPATTANLKIETSLVFYDPLSDLSREPVVDSTMYDAVYFDKGDSVAHAFTVSAKGAKSIAVNLNGGDWEEKTGAEAEFAVDLKYRQNIVGIRATDSAGKVKYFYKTVNARFIEVLIENATHPGKPFVTGDTAEVSFKGITLPIGKIPTIYNPQMDGFDPGITWTSTDSHVRYDCPEYDNNYLDWVKTQDRTQYGLAEHNTITLLMNEAGTFTFTNGEIACFWWGAGLGNELGLPSSGTSSMAAPRMQHTGSFLPDFTIKVIQGEPIPATDLDLSIDAISSASVITMEEYTDGTRDYRAIPGGKASGAMTFGDASKDANSFIATVSPVNADRRNIVWTSSDPEVARIEPSTFEAQLMFSNYNGAKSFWWIHTGKAGTATLTGTVEGTNISESFVVNVPSPQISSSLSPAYIYPGDTVTIVNSGLIARAARAAETITEDDPGAKIASIRYRYATDLPGLPTVHSGNLDTRYGRSNSFGFQIPEDTPTHKVYNLTNGLIVIDYTTSSGGKAVKEVTFDEIPDVAFTVYDPKIVVEPAAVYPGAEVHLTLGKGVTNPSAGPMAGLRLNLMYDTNIPGLPKVSNSARDSISKEIVFTVPENTAPGTYSLTNFRLEYSYFLIKGGAPDTGERHYGETIFDDQDSAPNPLKITVLKKP